MVTGKTFSTDVPVTPPAQVLAECFAAFERSADLDVDFDVDGGRLVITDGARHLRPSEVFDRLD